MDLFEGVAAMSSSPKLFSATLVVAAFFLMGASRFTQTSADPNTQILKLAIQDEILAVDLSDKSAEIHYFPNGALKELSFRQLNTHYHITFHQTIKEKEEQIAQVTQYQLAHGARYLQGASFTFDPSGFVLTETHWQGGKLHGPQRIFDAYHTAIEERFYDEGFPTGTWTTRYHDGTVAAEMHFPQSKQEWFLHARRGDLSSTELHKAAFGTAMHATETWYNQNGIKQKEREYRLLVSQNRPVITYEGQSRSYDHSGKVVRSENLWKGSGKEVALLPNESGTYRTQTHWMGGSVFREEWMFIPHPPPRRPHH